MVSEMWGMIRLVAFCRITGQVKSLSLASQLNPMLWLAEHGKELKPALHEFPKELDQQTALAKLEAMGIKVDKWGFLMRSKQRLTRLLLSRNPCNSVLE